MFGPVVVGVRSEGRESLVLGLRGRGMGGEEGREPVDTALIGTTAGATRVPSRRNRVEGDRCVAAGCPPSLPPPQHWIT